MMRNFFLLMALALCAGTVGAGPISRCETDDGRVVYSDEPCPSGTRRMRTVDEKPAVEVVKSAHEERAQDARSAGTLKRVAGAPESHGDHEASSELRKLKLAECDDLVRRIEYAQRDLNAAAEGERASAELSLRRLQAEHESKCGKPH